MSDIQELVDDVLRHVRGGGRCGTGSRPGSCCPFCGRVLPAEYGAPDSNTSAPGDENHRQCNKTNQPQSDPVPGTVPGESQEN